MRGLTLREMREERGLKAVFVAQRAGYSRSQLNKIEKKKDISVEELERVTRAMGLRPGDLLENSYSDIVPLLPLVNELKRFTPSAHERVREMLRAASNMLEEALAGGSTPPRSAIYTSASKAPQHNDELEEVAGLNGARTNDGEGNVRDGATEAASRTRTTRAKKETR